MKKLLLAAIFLAASLSAADVSGIWNGKGGVQDSKYGSIPHEMQMTLQQAGSSLQGTVKVDTSKPLKISSGSVSGSTVSIVVTVPSGQMTGSLSVVGNQLQGRMTTSQGRVYQMVFTKQ